MALKDLPTDAQPREKLLARGPGALADAELLARTRELLAERRRATLEGERAERVRGDHADALRHREARRPHPLDGDGA